MSQWFLSAEENAYTNADARVTIDDGHGDQTTLTLLRSTAIGMDYSTRRDTWGVLEQFRQLLPEIEMEVTGTAQDLGVLDGWATAAAAGSSRFTLTVSFWSMGANTHSIKEISMGAGVDPRTQATVYPSLTALGPVHVTTGNRRTFRFVPAAMALPLYEATGQPNLYDQISANVSVSGPDQTSVQQVRVREFTPGLVQFGEFGIEPALNRIRLDNAPSLRDFLAPLLEPGPEDVDFVITIRDRFNPSDTLATYTYTDTIIRSVNLVPNDLGIDVEIVFQEKGAARANGS